jgi:hypothetical protein
MVRFSTRTAPLHNHEATQMCAQSDFVRQQIEKFGRHGRKMTFTPPPPRLSMQNAVVVGQVVGGRALQEYNRTRYNYREIH